MKINENTNIGLPLRNLIGLIGAIVIGAWFAFGVIERLNNLETRNKLFEQDLLEASTQKPIDQEQFMLLEHMASQIEELENEMQGMRNNTVNLNRAMEDIKNIETNIENMKDKIRNNGSH